ncbi:MAG: alpha-amylase family protein [Woeseiaceae bacterium]|nr:alpha-amylase family protein [Woeseiaceae bacterium]
MTRSSTFYTVALLACALLLASCDREQPAPQAAPEPEPPSLNVFVHLFEWTWPSIARECEEFLAPAGYTAVQVSPPQEHAEGPQWWTRYQPVSYQLISRGGNREDFIDMVERCNAVGVGIYVDAVINHMTGVRSGVGVAGSPYGEYEYPGLYTYDDFNHCGRNENDDIVNFDDIWEVQHCELVNLADLRTDKPEVRAKLAAFLSELVDLGVAGFRIDAAKHMPAADLAAILDEVDGDPFVFLEVIATIDGLLDRSTYTDIAHVTEFEYLPFLHNPLISGQLAPLENISERSGLLPTDRAVVFVDNHDTQRHEGGHAFNYKEGDPYVLANVFMLAWPYGYPKVMSSFGFEDREAGPPTTEPVAAGATACNEEWICEHRWPVIANMVAFRVATAGEPVENWQVHDESALSFGRGGSGHVAINASDQPMEFDVQTNLAAGDYCDLVSASSVESCDGTVVSISDSGRFRAQLGPMSALAILRPR